MPLEAKDPKALASIRWKESLANQYYIKKTKEVVMRKDEILVEDYKVVLERVHEAEKVI